MVETDEMILREFNIPQSGRLLCPSVDHISQTVPKAGHLQRTGLGVVGEEPQVHLALGRHRQPLGVRHAAIRSHSVTLIGLTMQYVIL